MSPVSSQLMNQDGASEYGTLATVFKRLVRANAATAGAVVYRIAMNSRAHPAELRAAATLGTV